MFANSDVYEHPRKKKNINIFGKDPSTIDELLLMSISVMNDTCTNGNRKDKLTEAIGLVLKVQHTQHAPTTHSSPLTTVQPKTQRSPRTGTTPGWTGRVWLRLSKEPHNWASSILGTSLIYAGTGGYGGYDGIWSEELSALYQSQTHKKCGCIVGIVGFMILIFQHLLTICYKSTKTSILSMV